MESVQHRQLVFLSHKHGVGDLLELIPERDVLIIDAELARLAEEAVLTAATRGDFTQEQFALALNIFKGQVLLKLGEKLKWSIESYIRPQDPAAAAELEEVLFAPSSAIPHGRY
jgi:hypothetical protein